MKIFKKYSVAWLITILVIVASCAFGIAFAKADMIPVQTDDWVYDGANVLSAETEAQVRSYNVQFDAYYAYVAVATVNSLQGWDADEYAEQLFNNWELYGYDFMLLLDIGGNQSYLYYGSYRSGFDYSTYLETYVNPYFYSGDYDTAVLSLMEAMENYLIGVGDVSESGGNYVYSDWYGYDYDSGMNYSGGGFFAVALDFNLLLIGLVLFFVAGVIDRMRYDRWYRAYGAMTAPPILFAPIFFWHRPGSMWWRRHYRAPGMGHGPFDGVHRGGFGGGHQR